MCDLNSLAESTGLLRNLKSKNIQILQNIEVIRIGAFDGGWWSLSIANGNIIGKDLIQSRLGSWYEAPKREHSDGYGFAQDLINHTQPNQYCSYTAYGPLALTSSNNQSDCNLLTVSNPRIIIHHLHNPQDWLHKTQAPYPRIIEGKINCWVIEFQNEIYYDDTESISHAVLHLVKSFNTFGPSSNSQTTTTLEVFGAESLLQVSQAGLFSVLMALHRHSVMEDQDESSIQQIQLNQASQLPARATPASTENVRYGPLGLVEMVEYPASIPNRVIPGLEFVDVNIGKNQNFQVRFRPMEEYPGCSCEDMV